MRIYIKWKGLKKIYIKKWKYVSLCLLASISCCWFIHLRSSPTSISPLDTFAQTVWPVINKGFNMSTEVPSLHLHLTLSLSVRKLLCWQVQLNNVHFFAKMRLIISFEFFHIQSYLWVSAWQELAQFFTNVVFENDCQLLRYTSTRYTRPY